VATLAIVISSVHLSSQVGDRVDSNQEGRVAIEKITQALNSSCVSADLAPLTSTPTSTPAYSDGNDVVFYSSLSDNPAITPNKVEVSLVGGALIMYTYDYTGAANASPASWTWSSTPSTSFTLLPHAAASTVGGSAVPVFQYYNYSGSAISTTADSVPLTAASNSNPSVAEVAISFQAQPSDAYTANSRPSDFTDTVVLRLTPASSMTGSANAPCT
jgi:hypothetical protein